MQTQETDLLKDEDVVKLVPARRRFRLINMLVDNVVFSILLTFLCWLTGMQYPAPFSVKDGGLTFGGQGLLNFAISTILFALYIGLQEGALKGKTLGKLVTDTRAVDEKGRPVTYQKAFIRGLIRGLGIINAFSALGHPSYPLHDRGSRTLVIDEKESTLPES